LVFTVSLFNVQQ